MPATYEAAVQELEALLARLESGQLPLDELLTAYQRASALLDFCRQRLEAVEQQIRVIDNGQEKPWNGGGA
ncbi:Exodeoxyribonuclease 7 small subunit [Tepidimonas aquatica]|uniref:Exodeoxyribonuclease 7 small subunit n=2 Tax=Tepidimonas aquatica TaxID=247482 RepID=A0A554WU36_9BURK|nr:Exodeoxyribonuclease 7 small subunit [Tepidimonas aquatica]